MSSFIRNIPLFLVTSARNGAKAVTASAVRPWIVTADAGAESSIIQRFFIAVSKTSDPTSAFFVYNINVSKFLGAGNVFDFPDVGFDQDSVVVTANVFVDGGPFLYGAAIAIAKARLYNGLGFSVPFFTKLHGGTTPPIALFVTTIAHARVSR